MKKNLDMQCEFSFSVRGCPELRGGSCTLEKLNLAQLMLRCVGVGAGEVVCV